MVEAQFIDTSGVGLDTEKCLLSLIIPPRSHKPPALLNDFHAVYPVLPSEACRSILFIEFDLNWTAVGHYSPPKTLICINERLLFATILISNRRWWATPTGGLREELTSGGR
jgi:hypothetical protein